VAFSTAMDQFVSASNGSIYVRHDNAYRWDAATGAVTLVFDGQALGLATLDAVSLARGIEVETD
jgi:hypothetical protein